jgi:16S rRNA (guanine527-N7)-methyltransferase
MDQKLIATLLRPFLTWELSAAQLNKVVIYVDVLLKWNARINLTSIRNEDEVVTRHFGESFFLAQSLFPKMPSETRGKGDQDQGESLEGTPGRERVLDVGSGAGFPGLPMKIWADEVQLTMVEANHKKSTFLREVVRAIAEQDVSVTSERAESLAANPNFVPADVVTMRAVERFVEILPVALTLLAPGGRIALLVGRNQVASLKGDMGIIWDPPRRVPESESRELCLGTKRKVG